MPKRLNNDKNHASREAWMRDKKKGRPKQVWVIDDYADGSGTKGHWMKVSR